MDFKPRTVAKSKSSNGAVSAKADNGKNKKSLSNAQFQTSLVKKRGVYVEKRVLSSTGTQEANDIQVQPKAPRRPRPGQKKFLDSVLAILSKSTTGTQYPDIHDDSAKQMSRLKNTNDSEYKLTQKAKRPKKTKYRSRILKDEMLKYEREQLFVLQPRKEIVQTPSNTSFRAKSVSESIRLTDENKSKRTTIRDILENNIYSGVAEGITKELLEAKPTKEKRLRINDDPETLTSEIAKKDDKNMYNFFVDLLKTTISVYNVKAEHNVSDVSKTAFELDDTVAKKLDIKNNLANLDCISKCERKQITDNDIFDIVQDIPLDMKPSEYKAFSYTKPKIKSKSFPNNNSIVKRKAKPAPKSKSFDDNKKFMKKPNKKQILNDLKVELSKDIYTDTYNEPESLYDALRVMAKNKRRNEKSTSFYNKINNRNDYFDSECMLERINVISFGSRKKNKCKLPSSESRNNKKFENRFSNKKYIPSSYSLEVYGYDYYEPTKLLEGKREEREKGIIFNYHSSPSMSGSILGDNETLIYNDSSYSNFFVFNR